MDTKGNRIRSLLAALVLAAAVILTSCGGSSSNTADWPAMDSLKEIDTADVIRIDLQRLTEGGSYMNSVYDSTTIEDICLRLADVEITGETEEDVLDDSLTLVIKTEDKELTFSFEGDILLLEDGSRYEVEGLDTLRSYIDKLIEEMQSAGDTGGGGSRQSTASGGSYDIMENFEKRPDGSLVYLYFNDFMLTMPNNEKYSFEASDDKQSVTFYLFSAQQEGYGGRLVTIQAYDLDDTSYEEIPSYHVAGVGGNVHKRFIAIYPTDVQWNGNDTQQDADYRELQEHVQKIAEGMANSPFATADSDPEP